MAQLLSNKNTHFTTSVVSVLRRSRAEGLGVHRYDGVFCLAQRVQIQYHYGIGPQNPYHTWWQYVWTLWVVLCTHTLKAIIGGLVQDSDVCYRRSRGGGIGTSFSHLLHSPWVASSLHLSIAQVPREYHKAKQHLEHSPK